MYQVRATETIGHHQVVRWNTPERLHAKHGQHGAVRAAAVDGTDVWKVKVNRWKWTSENEHEITYVGESEHRWRWTSDGEQVTVNKYEGEQILKVVILIYVHVCIYLHMCMY